jgi:hypothetical protein
MQPITLSNGSPGLRAVLPISVAGAAGPEAAAANSQPVLDFVSSDATLDRYSEVICAGGWKLDRYRRNPVFQNAHQYGDIIFTLGRALVTDVRQVAGREALFQRIQFATDVNPIARIAHGLYAGGFLRAVSVGMIPLRWKDPDGHEYTSVSPRNTQHATCNSPGPMVPLSRSPVVRAARRIFLEQELIEVSAVAIPANPNALALAYRSGALDRCDLKGALGVLKSVFSTLRHAGRAVSPAATPDHLALARELHRLLRKI